MNSINRVRIYLSLAFVALSVFIACLFRVMQNVLSFEYFFVITSMLLFGTFLSLFVFKGFTKKSLTKSERATLIIAAYSFALLATIVLDVLLHHVKLVFY